MLVDAHLSAALLHAEKSTATPTFLDAIRSIENLKLIKEMARKELETNEERTGDDERRIACNCSTASWSSSYPTFVRTTLLRLS